LTRSIISTKRCITSRPLHCLRSRRSYFTDLGGMHTTTKTLGRRTEICWSYPGILGSSSESQSCCCLSAAFFCQGLYEQAALQETARARSRDPSNSQSSLCLSFLLRRRESASGTFETWRLPRAMSEFEGKAENMCSRRVLLSLTLLRHERQSCSASLPQFSGCLRPSPAIGCRRALEARFDKNN